MEAYRGIEVELHSFLNSEMHGGMSQSLLSEGNMPAVPTECEAERDPDSVWAFWRKQIACYFEEPNI